MDVKTYLKPVRFGRRVIRPRQTRISAVAKEKAAKKRQVRAIKRVVNKLAEKKYGDTVTETAVDLNSTNGLIVPLTQFAQGDADNNARTGDQITTTSMEYGATFKYNQQAAIGSSCGTGRFIIFRWHPFYSDIAPTVSSIINYTGFRYATLSPIVHDARKQMNILVDRVFTLDASHPFITIKGKLNLKNKKVQYKAASTTNAADGLYALFIADTVATSGVYISVTYYAFRINYLDM